MAARPSRPDATPVHYVAITGTDSGDCSTPAGACRDPKDHKFLAYAVEGKAHYLISSDHDLLHMRIFREVVIHNPVQYLLALQLSMLEADAMIQRFDCRTLESIQVTLLLEPATARRLAQAVGLAAGASAGSP